jgi:4-alpha-glucanotransferase
LETGEARSWKSNVDLLPTSQAITVERVAYVAKRLSLPTPLPWGYHRLTLEVQGRHFETMVISAPLTAYSSCEEPAKFWGVFLPLYALHSARSWGGGDFSDLEALIKWTAELGGSVVGTLPLLAAFLDEPYDPSPYAPASRLFWNEFYIDLTRIPELKPCSQAQALFESGDVQRDLRDLRASPFVDYRRQMALKQKVLKELAQYFFTEIPERHTSFRRFVEHHPEVEDYARFRAAVERQGAPWPSWPRPLHDGVLKEGDYDETARQYHRYVQWVTHEQMQNLSQSARAAGVKLYLDLPLGVHPHSYDIWRERGFPPLHPEAIRQQRYRYYIATLRHQLRHTDLLRIDHVMGLHRLYWIPNGLAPRDGVYVRYPSNELYAILSLESHRHRTPIVGENLGTVPTYVNSTMARHSLHRMYVAQYELVGSVRKTLRAVPRDAVASLNTHDIAPFAAFWEGLDIDDRLDLGLLNPVGARIERKNRRALKNVLESFLQRLGWLKPDSADLQPFLRAFLRFLSASPAWVALVNLEDLWLEREPQNVPGTLQQRPNWQRKARHSFEAFSQMPEVLDTLKDIDRHRKGESRP